MSTDQEITHFPFRLLLLQVDKRFTQSSRPREIFLNSVTFKGEEMIAASPTSKMEGHLFSAVHNR